ncbi:hypothetical protein B0J14DRAFT_275288 [Halenospora varia]|nr:hypothetical protein B0J14DRAFT_275288 [Halenospora varia]
MNGEAGESRSTVGHHQGALCPSLKRNKATASKHAARSFRSFRSSRSPRPYPSATSSASFEQGLAAQRRKRVTSSHRPPSPHETPRAEEPKAPVPRCWRRGSCSSKNPAGRIARACLSTASFPAAVWRKTGLLRVHWEGWGLPVVFDVPFWCCPWRSPLGLSPMQAAANRISAFFVVVHSRLTTREHFQSEVSASHRLCCDGAPAACGAHARLNDLSKP